MKTDFQRTTNYELYTLVKRVLAINIADAEIKASAQPFITAIGVGFTPFEAVISKTTYSGLGDEVKQSDVLRDALFIGVRDTLAAYIKLNRAGAADLYAIVSKYGTTLHREKFNVQTGKMQELMKEFELPTNASKLENLGLQADVAQMKVAQSNFETLIARQSESNADLRELEAASNLKPALVKALTNYCKFLNALENISPNWNALYNDVKENTRVIKISKTDKKPD